MWIVERLAEITTPKTVRSLTTSQSEKIVNETLNQQEERWVTKLYPTVRAAEWAKLGIADFTASYLRRSIMRPRRKKEILYHALFNKFAFLWYEGELEKAVTVTHQMGNLRIRNASLPHIF